MDPEQELVFGWMGLSPALLLDPVPSGDNLMVRVVRPDADADAVLEEARQQLAASGSRRRRRGRGGEGRNGAPEISEPAELQEVSPMLEITPAPFETSFEPATETSPFPPLPVAVAEPVASRRSKPAEAAAAGAGAGEAEVADGGASDGGEPRRRRRRSSASG
jgi:ribonuclease E